MSDEEFVQVVKEEGSEVMEFPTEDDGTILLRDICSQFATAIGLKYKGPSGAWRAIKNGDDGTLLPPKDGWGDIVYQLTFNDVEETSRKRKADNYEWSADTAKSVKSANKGNYLLRDLAVVGIPYEAKKDELQEYFNNKYGGVTHFIINHDQATGRPKGYGFIRFDNEESAKNALEGEDEFLDRPIHVKTKKVKPIKMYTNDLPDGTTKEDLVDYFSQFGVITDSYVPTPFRNYAFFTFASTEDGKECLQQNHIFKGQPIKVSIRRDSSADGGSRGGFRGGQRGGFGGQRGGFNGDRGKDFGARGGGYSSRDGGRDNGYGGRDSGQNGGGYNNQGSSMNPQMKNELKSMLYEVLSG